MQASPSGTAFTSFSFQEETEMKKHLLFFAVIVGLLYALSGYNKASDKPGEGASVADAPFTGEETSIICLAPFS